jgi:hypothetical protein
MKKLFYILLIAFSTSMAITSCTEEEITPKDLNEGTPTNGGTGTSGGTL